MTTYSLEKQAVTAGLVATSTLTGRTLARGFTVSAPAGMTGIWFRSASGAGALPTACCVFDAANTATPVTGTLNSSPSWSGAAGSGWVKCTYDGTITLQVGHTYYVCVYYAGDGVNKWWSSATTWPSSLGGGTPFATTVSNGPLNALVDNGTTPAIGQDSSNPATTGIAYPNHLIQHNLDLGVDIEVNGAPAPVSVGATVGFGSANARAFIGAPPPPLLDTSLYGNISGPYAASNAGSNNVNSTSFGIVEDNCYFKGFRYWKCPTGNQLASAGFALYLETGAGTGSLIGGTHVTTSTMVNGWNTILLDNPLQLQKGSSYRAVVGTSGPAPINAGTSFGWDGSNLSKYPVIYYQGSPTTPAIPTIADPTGSIQGLRTVDGTKTKNELNYPSDQIGNGYSLSYLDVVIGVPIPDDPPYAWHLFQGDATGAGAVITTPQFCGTGFNVNDDAASFVGYRYWVSSDNPTTGVGGAHSATFGLWHETGDASGEFVAGSKIAATWEGNWQTAWQNVVLPKPIPLVEGESYRIVVRQVDRDPGTVFRSTALSSGPISLGATTTTAGTPTYTLVTSSSGDVDTVYPSTSSTQFWHMLDPLVTTSNPVPARLYQDFEQGSTSVGNILANASTIALQFNVSRRSQLTKILHYSPTLNDSGGPATVLPQKCALWDASTKQPVPGTMNISPAWKNLADGTAATAGVGWIYCDYTSADIYLERGSYYVSTYYGAPNTILAADGAQGKWGGLTSLSDTFVDHPQLSSFVGSRSSANGLVQGPLSKQGVQDPRTQGTSAMFYDGTASLGNAALNATAPDFDFPNYGSSSDYLIDMEVIPVPTSGSSAYRAAVKALVPTAFWPMNDAPGSTTAYDDSGNGNTATVVGGVTFGATDPWGGTEAASFNGTTGYLTAAGALANAWTSRTFTWMGYLNLSSGATSAFFSTLPRNIVFNAIGRILTYNLLAGQGWTTGVEIPDGWLHLAITNDGSRVTIIVNGVEVASTANTWTPIGTATQVLIGAFTTTSQFWAGDMAGVALFNRPLSTGEIRGAIASTNSIKATALINAHPTLVLPASAVIGAADLAPAPSLPLTQEALFLSLPNNTLDLRDINNGMIVVNFDPGFATPRQSSADWAEQDGQFDTTQFLTARVAQLQIAAAPTGPLSIRDVVDLLAPFCDPTARPQIQWRTSPGEPLRTMTGVFMQGTAPIQNALSQVQLQWRIPDGVAYSMDQETQAIQAGTTSPGFSFPITFPISFGNSSHQAPPRYIAVSGTYRTWGTFRFYGPWSGVTSLVWIDPVSGLATGPQIVFKSSASCLAGDFIEVDTKAKTVTINGDPGGNRYSFLDLSQTVWGTLSAGQNLLHFQTSNTDATCSAFWTPTFI